MMQIQNLMMIPVKISCNGKTAVIGPTGVILVDNDGSVIQHENPRN